VLVVVPVVDDAEELDEELVVPQPIPVESHLQGTQAEPEGLSKHPAPGPQLLIAVQPIWVQNHSD